MDEKELIQRIDHVLIPGNGDRNEERRLLDEARDLLSDLDELLETKTNYDDTGEEADDEKRLGTPQAEVYDRLEYASMRIGECPARWEILQAAEPMDRKLRRITLWIEEDDWQEHVDLHPEDEEPTND